MAIKILVNAGDPAECRIATVKDGKLEEFHTESAAREIAHGNIYKGIITRIEPGLQAVFVDYGAERQGFLQKSEIHPDYYHDTSAGEHSITQLVKRGQELLVQVIKDPYMKKGAVLSTYISLPGRYVVLMPGSESRGVSRKIESEEERKRLREIVEKLKLPEMHGAIVRTAGMDCNKTQISNDINYLMRLWKTIKDNVMKVPAPALLYKERSLVMRSIRDYFTPDIDEILVDDAEVHRELREFMKIISPRDIRIVKHYKGDKPIFTKYELESQIATIFESRVNLTSGGTIVIAQTEALVAIDVNSGKATQKKSIEETALQTNLEAADEIARQLRLRDLGGLIVLDFIDMRETKHRTQVERALKNHLKIDKAKTKVGRISQFGLLEMSRQRIRPSIEYGSFQLCSYCRGKGQVPSPETLGVAFLRKLSLDVLKDGIARITATLPGGVADFILNRKRKDIMELEEKRHIQIFIQTDPALMPGESRIVCD